MSHIRPPRTSAHVPRPSARPSRTNERASRSKGRRPRVSARHSRANARRSRGNARRSRANEKPPRRSEGPSGRSEGPPGTSEGPLWTSQRGFGSHERILAANAHGSRTKYGGLTGRARSFAQWATCFRNSSHRFRKKDPLCSGDRALVSRSALDSSTITIDGGDFRIMSEVGLDH